MRNTILFVTPTLAQTGSEIALTALLKATNLKDARCLVYTYGKSGPLAKQLSGKMKVIQPPLANLGKSTRTIDLLQKKIISPLFLKFLLLRFQPRLVYINTVTLSSVIKRLWLRSSIILHTHELEPMFAGLNESQMRELIEKPDFVIAASERAAQVFRTLGRTKPMAVVPSPIDFESLQSLTSKTAARRRANESFIWLMAGSLDANKNPVRFVEIARKCMMKRKQDRFVWLGGQETGYSLYAKSLAREYGLADRISWVNPKDHADYLNRFSAAHGIVITSDVESLSLVAIEGLALGKPVVSFDNGGTGEILGRKHGVLVPKYDIDFCVNKMTRIASGSLKFSASQLRKRAQEFDVSRVKDQWLQILESVAKQ